MMFIIVCSLVFLETFLLLGIVIHGVRMGGWVLVGRVCQGYISETARYKKLILDRDISWGVVVV